MWCESFEWYNINLSYFLSEKKRTEQLVKELIHLRGECCELLFVDGSLINGVRDRQVDEFAAEKH